MRACSPRRCGRRARARDRAPRPTPAAARVGTRSRASARSRRCCRRAAPTRAASRRALRRRPRGSPRATTSSSSCAGEHEVGLADEARRHLLVRVDDHGRALRATTSTSGSLPAATTRSAPSRQVHLPGRDPHAVQSLAVRRRSERATARRRIFARARSDRAARHACLRDARRARVGRSRSRRPCRRRPRSGCCAPRRSRRARGSGRLGSTSDASGRGGLRLRAAQRHEARAEPLEAAEILVAGRLVDARACGRTRSRAPSRTGSSTERCSRRSPRRRAR